jgi:hypothetical protein
MGARKRKTPKGQATSRAAVKRWRKRNPEKYRESIARRAPRRRPTPRSTRSSSPIGRIDYRLRAEREGRARCASCAPRPTPTATARRSTAADSTSGRCASWSQNGSATTTASRWAATTGTSTGWPPPGYEQLADLTGVSDRTLREVAHGERSFVLYETADRICTGLDTPLASLYPDER